MDIYMVSANQPINEYIRKYINRLANFSLIKVLLDNSLPLLTTRFIAEATS